MINYLQQLDAVRQAEQVEGQEEQTEADAKQRVAQEVESATGVVGAEVTREALSSLRPAASVALKTVASKFGSSAAESAENVANDLASGGLKKALTGAINRGVTSATNALTRHDDTRATDEPADAPETGDAATRVAETGVETATEEGNAASVAAAAASGAESGVSDAVSSSTMTLRDIINDPAAFRDFVSTDGEFASIEGKVEDARQELLGLDNAGALDSAESEFTFARSALPPGVSEDIQPGFRVLADVTGNATRAAEGAAQSAATSAAVPDAVQTAASAGESAIASAGETASAAATAASDAVSGAVGAATTAASTAATTAATAGTAAVEGGTAAIEGGLAGAAGGTAEIPVVGPLIALGLGLAAAFGPLFAHHKHHPTEAPIVNPSSQFGA